MRGLHRAARRASAVCLAAGLLALGYAAYVMIDARAYQHLEKRRFEQARREAAATAALTLAIPALEAVVVRPPAEGESIGELLIPRLGIDLIIAQGDSPAILRRAVGHLRDSVLPGATGNVVLAGHRDTFFRPLKDVRAGDAITLKTQHGDFDYLVDSTFVVRPTDVEALEPTGEPILTLITCFPFYYVGAAPDRFIVRARAAPGAEQQRLR